jgi:superfamily II RNA helicase
MKLRTLALPLILVSGAAVAQPEGDYVSLSDPTDTPMQKQAAKEIRELEQRNAELQERVNLLERVATIFNESPDLTFEEVERLFSEDLDRRNIEQQVKGLKDYQLLCGFADCRKSIDARISQLEEKLNKIGDV